MADVAVLRWHSSACARGVELSGKIRSSVALAYGSGSEPDKDISASFLWFPKRGRKEPSVFLAASDSLGA